ncbi:MAG: glycosyl transferase family 2 [Mucilaginibacter sp.]|nr:glycosyl transferase family 2 [Mucilaginibacter sp.]
MNNPRISVITVCFNAAASIERTIKSVVDQSYTNIEYVIVDGGSIDGTVDIIKNYESLISSWVSEPDKGIYDAMNKGIDMVNGSWVYFLGAGDTLLNILDKLTPNFTKPNCIYYGNVYRKDLKRIYDGRYTGFKLAVTNICHQAIFYPLPALKKYRYDTKYKMLADHHLNMLCYGDKTFDFKYIPMQIGIYEGDGISAITADEEFYKDKIGVVKRNFPFMIYLYAYMRRTMAKALKNKK